MFFCRAFFFGILLLAPSFILCNHQATLEQARQDLSFFKKYCCNVEHLTKKISDFRRLDYERAVLGLSTQIKKIEEISAQKNSLGAISGFDQEQLERSLAVHSELLQAFAQYLYEQAFFFFSSELMLPAGELNDLSLFHDCMIEVFCNGYAALEATQELFYKKQHSLDGRSVPLFHDRAAQKNNMLAFMYNLIAGTGWSQYLLRYKLDALARCMQKNSSALLEESSRTIIAHYIEYRFLFCYKNISYTVYNDKRTALLNSVQQACTLKHDQESNMHDFYVSVRDQLLKMRFFDDTWPDYYVAGSEDKDDCALALTFAHLLQQPVFKSLTQQKEIKTVAADFVSYMTLYFQEKSKRDAHLLHKCIFLQKTIEQLHNEYAAGWLKWFVLGDSCYKNSLEQMQQLVRAVIIRLEDQLYPSKGFIASLMSGEWFKSASSEQQKEGSLEIQNLLKKNVGNVKVATLPIVGVVAPSLLIALLKKYMPNMPEGIKKSIENYLLHYVHSGDIGSLLSYLLNNPEISEECSKQDPQLFASLHSQISQLTEDKQG